MRPWLLMLVVCGSAGLAAQAGGPQVTPQDLADGLKDPGKWLTYGGDYNGHRYSPLTQITPQNVSQLAAQWTFQTGTLGSFQTTPMVVDGVLYVRGSTTTRGRSTRAPDARSGAIAAICQRTGAAAAARSTAVSACSAISCSWRRSTRTSSRST